MTDYVLFMKGDETFLIPSSKLPELGLDVLHDVVFMERGQYEKMRRLSEKLCGEPLSRNVVKTYVVSMKGSDKDTAENFPF